MNPLDPLRDIHLPPPPSGWPPAPGWWLLAALLLITLVAAVLILCRRYRQRGYRRTALNQLHELECSAQSDDIHAFLTLVRRTARAGNTHSDWPALPAITLLMRLDQASQNRLSAELQAAGSDLEQLATRQYQLKHAPYRPTSPPNSEVVILKRWCRWWIGHHKKVSLC